MVTKAEKALIRKVKAINTALNAPKPPQDIKEALHDALLALRYAWTKAPRAGQDEAMYTAAIRKVQAAIYRLEDDHG